MYLYYYTYIEYSYWGWSITKIFKELLINKYKYEILLKKNEGIFLLNNKKFQFIKEMSHDKHNYNDVYCKYNNIIIFNNRYSIYDYNKHIFNDSENIEPYEKNIIHNDDLIKNKPYPVFYKKIFNIKKIIKNR